jgi:hypothetical protein
MELWNDAPVTSYVHGGAVVIMITDIELSDVFGVLVHLSYFFNPIRRKVLDVRAGQARPDAEVKRYMPFE